ncbi:MAG TPA: MotA/TolQ/ExbB proton channel family protein [Xanthomonadales bacterium]|nr:MotA/TolQ/ExbB proton channel family protein [Xanthomonadales bacterium]
MSNIRKLFLCAALAALPFALTDAFAQDSLDSLLDEVRTVRAEETRAFEQRSTEFSAATAAQQQKMLADAQARRDALAQTSNKLSDQFSANEIRINDVRKLLREKATSLGLTEVFGISRQVAGDAAIVLRQSLITTQFPPLAGQLDRDDFLREYAASQTTPTPVELERVWFELQREMTTSGQVAKYTTNVVQPGGEAFQAEVIRIGPFTATSNGKFLSYLPNLKTLNVFPRQPPDEFLGYVPKLESASGGYVESVVDSARGVLMSLYVERPTWGQRIELGEEIGYVIILVGLAASLAFFGQLVYLLMVRMAVGRQLKSLTKLSKDNPLGRVLLAFKGDPNLIEQDADIAELRISEAVLREVPKLERFQSFLRLSVAAGPLLGLIGTVVGMILTFQSITESGSSDPKLMATGIGQAMIATVLGLGIAIPLLFANAILNSLSKSVSQILDEQAVGMLAESIEKQRRA